MRLPKYLFHILLWEKREENTESVYVCDVCHVFSNQTFDDTGHEIFFCFMDFRCLSSVLHSRIHTDAFSFQCSDCNATSKKDIQLRAMISILLGHSI